MPTSGKIYNTQSEVISNEVLCPGYYRITLKADSGVAGLLLPGKFLSIKCGNNTFLRRPFSVSGVEKDRIEILYKALGPASQWLSEQNPGGSVDILYPLGNGFPVGGGNAGKVQPVFIGGGTGVASLLSLAKFTKKPAVFFYGARTKKEIICGDILEKYDVDIKISTEDGSKGFKGLVTDLFLKYVNTLPGASLVVYSCGPYAMLKAVSLICGKDGIDCYVSLEEIMACGIGACRGCVVKIRSGKGYEYKTACGDGPVFKSDTIVWQ